jgi:serine/arginine repetitive matrix protein 2
MGGVGFLATKTLLGNQLVAPTVGTPTSSEGTQTQQTRSGTSHARTLSSGGHSRAGSKGKIAVMRAATGLCISGDKMSPQDEREDPTTRYDNVVAIGIEGQQHLLVPTSAAAPSPSPVPTAMDSATVGIALSSPLPSTEEVAAIVQQQPSRSPTYARDHPYAHQGAPPPPQRSHTRSSSDYAGPHPSAVPVTASALASDMSARHRLPPQAVLHPYATSSALPNAASSQQQPVQALPEAPSSRHHRFKPRGPSDNERAIPHAYAAANRISSGPLVFADALSYGHQRRFSADSGLGDSEGHNEGRSGPAQVLAPFPGVVLTTSPEYVRADLERASPFLSFHTVASSSLNQPAFLSTSPDMRRSAQTSSADEHGPGSRASSPLQSPRPFGTIEDLDRYRNLFYYPKNSVVSGSGSASDEQQQQQQQQHRRTFSCDTSSFAGLEVSSAGGGSLAGGSGLAALTRQLSNEFGAAAGADGRGSSSMWWLRGHRASEVYSNSDLNTDPDATLLPLSLHQSLHPPSEGSFTMRIPQDVESHSHSSSVMEGVASEIGMEPLDLDDGALQHICFCGEFF